MVAGETKLGCCGETDDGFRPAARMGKEGRGSCCVDAMRWDVLEGGALKTLGLTVKLEDYNLI
jgi:hypothetical protein